VNGVGWVVKEQGAVNLRWAAMAYDDSVGKNWWVVKATKAAQRYQGTLRKP